MIDETKQAVILLSTYFSSHKKGDPTPLTPTEYGRFAQWLNENQFQPKDLFHQFKAISEQWVDPKNKITNERLQYLLGRGLAMGMALEKWQRAGIWIISRSDSEYPKRLKRRLGSSAPAVLFGVGNMQLLNAGGLSIVGSRNIDDADQQYTKMIARQAAMEGLNVISGGARGVDETAMLASLEIDGTALGILANDLFKAALASKWRQYIKSSQIALISPFYPEAPFQVGNAMGRNKYIYCLSEYALVVRAEKGKGGTWSGATENCKKGWVPLFVKSQSDASGNIALVAQGAFALNTCEEGSDGQTDWLLMQLKRKPTGSESKVETGSTDQTTATDEVATHSVSPNSGVEEESEMLVVESSAPDENSGLSDLAQTIEPYQLFIELFEKIQKEHSQITLALLKEDRKDLKQKQIIDWLDRASEEGLIERHGKRRTYTLKEPDLFA